MEGLSLWQLALFAAGVTLLLCEAAAPGVGLAGIGGIALLLGCFLPSLLAFVLPWYVFPILLAACICLLMDSNLPGIGPLAWFGLAGLLAALLISERDAAKVLGTLSLTAVLSIPCVCLTILHIPSSKQMRKLSLEDTLKGSGLQAPSAQRLDEATALSDLHPGGVVWLNGQRVHATAKSGYIEKGSTVRVLRMQNGEAVVEKKENKSPAG